MLKSNSALKAAKGLMTENYQETMAKLKDAAEITLNSHVDNFMAELRATYPQFQFDFSEEHFISVYDPSIPVGDDIDDNSDHIMTVRGATKLDSDQRDVGMVAAMQAFLSELDTIESTLDSVVIELEDNYQFKMPAA